MSFALVLFMRELELARLRVGRPMRATAGASAQWAEVPCAARLPKAAPPLALAWPARRSRVAPMLGVRHARRRDALKRVAMPLGSLRCSAPYTRARTCPPAALRAPWWRAIGVHRCRWQSRGWVCGGATYAAPRSGGLRRLRVAVRRRVGEDWSSAEHSGAARAASRPCEGEFRSRLRSPSTAGHPERSAGRCIMSAIAYPPAALLTQVLA